MKLLRWLSFRFTFNLQSSIFSFQFALRLRLYTHLFKGGHFSIHLQGAFNDLHGQSGPGSLTKAKTQIKDWANPLLIKK